MIGGAGFWVFAWLVGLGSFGGGSWFFVLSAQEKSVQH